MNLTTTPTTPKTPTMPTQTPQPGTRLFNDRYEIHSLLGQGRLSTVYRAQDLHLQKPVALKILQPHLRAQPVVVQRFRREMAAVQRLQHPATLQIFDILETPDHLALIMDFVPGIHLKDWIRTHGPMPHDRITPIAITILEAIDQAHTRGIVHRDLSLANIIFDEPNQDKTGDDQIKIIGFGLARVDELVGLTMHTRVLGTLETMAPECILGKTADSQSDLYAIGAILYELATATPLHDGRMSSALSFAQHHDFLSIIQKTLENTALPTALIHIITRALAPDPSLRFATARQMRDALAGNYDADTWHALQTRSQQACPACEKPLITGLSHCLYCGHTLRQLVKDPAEGNFDLWIGHIHPNTTDPSTPPDTLTQQQVQALHDLLASYEDTRQIFRPQFVDQYPPYILFDQLTNDDAQNIARILRERNIPNHIAPHSTSSSPLNAAVSLALNPNVHVPNPLSSPIVYFPAMLLLLPLALLVLVAQTTPEIRITLLIPAIIGSLFFGILGRKVGQHQRKAFEDHWADFPHLENLEFINPARIPGMLLQNNHSQLLDNILPPDATSTLALLDDPNLQREFHDLLAFATQLHHDARVPTRALQEALDPILNRTSRLLKRLETLRNAGPKNTTAELFDQLQRSEQQIADAHDTETTHQLITQHAALLEQIAELDSIVQETSLLHGHLLHVRATLFDLQSEFHGQNLPSIERLKAELDELKIRLDAEHEVLQLVGEA